MRQGTRSIIPNLFTVLNLFSGFIAIKTAFVDHDFEKAGWFIVLGAIFDVLDGLMARLTHSASDFGVELDSLADVVTFGVAPSAIIYELYFYQVPRIGLLIAALPAICGALRLARFNSQLTGYDKEYFKGLPIPSGAILIVSFITFHFIVPSVIISEEMRLTALWFVVIGASLMEISTVRYEAMPKFSKQGLKEKPIVFGAIVLGIAASAATKGVAIFPLFALFVLFGLIRSLIERIGRYLKDHRAVALFDEEELEREDEAAFGG
jgi:CDP-diacylglycerol--serine O-phosphatidyltransferase